MRIDSLLNEGPTSDPNALSPGITSVYKVVQPVHSTDGKFSRHASYNTSAADPAVSQLLSQYSPRQQATDTTISSRSSYSGSSLRSTAATSPLEASMPSLSATNDRSVHSSAILEPGETISGSGSSFPGRTLPPLTTMVTAVSSGSAVCDGPLSPHSTGTSHYHHHSGPEMGYFTSSRVFYQDQPSQQQYTQPFFPLTQQPHDHVRNNALMSFAEVAMETATVGGRRNLELEAAAEASRRNSGGSFTEDSIRRNSAPTAVDSRGKTDRATVSRTDRGGGMVSSNKPLFLDLDPALRPPSASSVASTGRTIEEDDQVQGSSQADVGACSIADPNHENAPLFRPTPEPHTPTLANVDIEPSATLGTGPLNIPSPSPQSFLNEAPKCSYCNVCTTGSPLRKVVSHIFGRNKLSTRQIPKNVWVYYCRKHYQRSRYRNPRGFARQQVLLVKRQCERLQLWGGVKDWVIKVRRREELRMNREVGENGEDADEAEDEEEALVDEEPEPNDGGPTSGESSRRNSTTVPRRRSSAGGGSNWIMRYTGMEKTIEDIYLLLGKIELEVQENGGKFPDVELLPNVDLTMATPFIEAEDGGEGGNGNAGDDDKQEDAEDGVSGRKAGKKRRRSDGGSGSSGGDDGGDSKGSKKAKNSSPKKGDRRGKNKGPSHAEVAPDQASVDTSGSPENSQFPGSIKGSPAHDSIDIPMGHRRVHSDFGNGVIHSGYHGVVHPEQTVTPPPSTSSTGRSTPEFEDRLPARHVKGRRIRGSVTQESYNEATCNISPRRSARVLPVVVTVPEEPEFTRRNSVTGSLSPSNFTPRQLAAIAGEPLHRFDLRRQEPFGFGEVITEPSGRRTPEKSKTSFELGGGVGRARPGGGSDEVYEFIRVATNV